MIANASNIQDDDFRALITLSDSAHLFYPCGSRYFGYFTEASDYDFFFEKSDVICDWLMDNFWIVAPMQAEYMDVNTCSIWTRGNIHCMEVRCARNRIAIQDMIFGKRFGAENPVPGFRPPKGDRLWWNKQYCEMFPDQYTMPKEITAAEKRSFPQDIVSF